MSLVETKNLDFSAENLPLKVGEHRIANSVAANGESYKKEVGGSGLQAS